MSSGQMNTVKQGGTPSQTPQVAKVKESPSVKVAGKIAGNAGAVDGAAAAAAAAAAVAAASAAVAAKAQGQGPVEGLEKDEDAIKLFIGQIPRTFDETALKPMFEPYGDIYELRVIRNKQTGAHCGCAFLTYCTRASAEAARKHMHNEHQLQGCGHPMQVRYAEGQAHLIGGEHKLFVGMVPKQATEDDLRALFSKYGEMTEVAILRDNAKNSKGCGFIKFTKRDSAQAAIGGLHEKHTMEGGAGPIVVKWADNGSQKLQRGRGPPPGFRPPGMPQMFPGMPPMPFPSHGMPFYPHGPPPAMGGRPPMPHQQGSGPMSPGAMPSGPPGYNNAPMYGAPQGMPPSPHGPMHTPMSGAAMYGGANMGGGGGGAYNPFNNGQQGPPVSAAGAGVLAGKTGKVSGPEGSNLFIRSLPQEWGDNDLFVTFAPFGTVLSTKIAVDMHTGLSRCYGFVSYDNPQSAQAAIQSMNGLQVGSTRLNVELKTPRNRPY